MPPTLARKRLRVAHSPLRPAENADVLFNYHVPYTHRASRARSRGHALLSTAGAPAHTDTPRTRRLVRSSRQSDYMRVYYDACVYTIQLMYWSSFRVWIRT